MYAELWLAQSLNSPLAAGLRPPPPSSEFVYSALGMKVGGKQMGFHELWKWWALINHRTLCWIKVTPGFAKLRCALAVWPVEMDAIPRWCLATRNWHVSSRLHQTWAGSLSHTPWDSTHKSGGTFWNASLVTTASWGIVFCPPAVSLTCKIPLRSRSSKRSAVMFFGVWDCYSRKSWRCSQACTNQN